MASYIEFQKAFFSLLAAVGPTFLWAAFAVWVIVKFRSEVGRLVDSISGRIERGAEFSGLGFSIKDVRQLPLDEQKERLDDAVRQETSSAPADPRAGGVPQRKPQHQPQAGAAEFPQFRHNARIPMSDEGIRRDIFDAEVLGVRFLNLIIGLPFTPNVRIDGAMVDGAFLDGDAVRAVAEVSLIRNRVNTAKFIRQLTVLSEKMAAGSPKRRPIQVVGMAVLSDEISEEDFWAHVSTLRPANDFPFVFHGKSLPWLRNQFGLIERGWPEVKGAAGV